MFRASAPLRCFLAVTLLLLAAGVGCNSGIGQFVGRLTGLANAIGNIVNDIQQQDPRTIEVPTIPDGTNNTIIISEQATVITSVETQLLVAELPNITLLGLENLTSFDIYLRFRVDGEEQAVFVQQGETLLLEYDCLDEVELLTEYDFVPGIGLYQGSFDFDGTTFDNGPDFACGEALILSIDDQGVVPARQLIDLSN